MVKRKWKNHNILIILINSETKVADLNLLPKFHFSFKEILINMVIYDIFCVLKMIQCK